MFHDQRSALSGYVSGLLSAGRVVFTAEEAEQAIGVGRGAFLDWTARMGPGTLAHHRCARTSVHLHWS